MGPVIIYGPATQTANEKNKKTENNLKINK